MLGWLALIQLRWKLYALVAGAFLFGILGMRSRWIDNALAKEEARRDEARIEAMREANGVRRDVEVMDDTGLSDRASRWLREKP